MAKMPKPLNKTAIAIYGRHEKDKDDWRREHLGASLIGHACNRYLWYQFRWASDPKIKGRMLRLFERGQREEDWIVEELRATGMRVEVSDRDGLPNTDGSYPQWRFEEFGGHFGGSIDGAILGVPEAKVTWHLLEVKTSNDKRFKTLEKDGVKKSNPQHFAQMQIYMHALTLTRALYVCVSKNDDYIYTERIKYDEPEAYSILAKAKRIIDSDDPLTRISEDPAWFKCKWCDHQPHCQLGEVEKLDRNCRTCLSSAVSTEHGTWSCTLHKIILDGDAQRKGCDDHLFIPKMLGQWDATGVDEKKRMVYYKLPDGSKVIDCGRRGGFVGEP